MPHHRGFTLVGDACGADVGRAQAVLGQCLLGRVALGLPDFGGAVFHPSRLRKVLGKFLLCQRDDIALPVKDDGAAAGSTLVERSR